jgi:hypothetical protein
MSASIARRMAAGSVGQATALALAVVHRLGSLKYRLLAGSSVGVDSMGLLGVFGLLWIAGAAVYLAYAGRSSHTAVWRSKYGETWPKSRRGHMACFLVLAVTGAVCLVHDCNPAWDKYAVPALFGSGIVLILARWADRLASTSDPCVDAAHRRIDDCYDTRPVGSRQRWPISNGGCQGGAG